jgi:TolA-binding protein
MALYKAGRFADAAREFELVAGAGGRNAALASLYAARSVQQTSGCSVAAPRYEAVAARFPGTAAAGDALWAAAACQRSMGNFERARDLYLSLRTVAGYRDRAEAELANLAAALPAVGARRGGARR